MITNCESGIILQKQRTSFLLLEFRLRFFQVKDHGMCDLESVNLYDFVHCNGVSLKQDGFIRRKGSSNDWALYLSDGPARADCLEAFCKAKQSNDLFYISDDAVSIFLGKIFAAHFSPDVLPVASEASRCFSGPEDSAVSPSFTSKLGDKESLRDKQPEFIFFSSGWQVCTVYDLWRIWNDVTQIRLAIRLFSRTPKVQDSEALHENAGRLEKPSCFAGLNDDLFPKFCYVDDSSVSQTYNIEQTERFYAEFAYVVRSFFDRINPDTQVVYLERPFC